MKRIFLFKFMQLTSWAWVCRDRNWGSGFGGHCGSWKKWLTTSCSMFHLCLWGHRSRAKTCLWIMSSRKGA